MLLQILDRKEKLKFLDLAVHMINVDGQMSEGEKRLLDVMIAEVGVNIVSEYNYELSGNLDETLSFFENKSDSVKRLVYLNLLVLAMLEEFYNTSEHFFLEDVRTALSIDDKVKTKLMRLVNEQRDLNDKMKRAING